MPSTPHSILSPGKTAATPAGVPVMMMSPAPSATCSDSFSMISGTLQISSARSPFCRSAPLTESQIRPLAGWPIFAAGCSAPQGAERHRPPLLRDRRDVVLPLCPRRTGQKVRGAGLEGEFGRLPGAGPAAAEPHPAGGQQRDAADLAELRRVAVPADARAGRVARHEQIRQLPGFAFHQPGAAVAEPLQPGRDRRRRDGIVRAGDQGKAEASHQPPRWRVVQHIRTQLERRQHRQHITLLGLGDEAGHVDQTLRHRHRVASPARRRAGAAEDRAATVLIPGKSPQRRRPTRE